MNIINVPSPNYYPGRQSFTPIAIVIHIMEGSLSATDSWFSGKASRVSAHYGVGINGDVHQYVQENDTAWHAGRINDPGWQLLKPSPDGGYFNPNYYTIGIEHEGHALSDWTDQMYQASSSLIKSISSRWNIPLDRNHIIGHHEIYSIKTCPGFKVDLNKLVAMASGSTLQNSQPAFAPGTGPLKILQMGKATTTARLNIRSSPDRGRAQLRIVEQGAILPFDGFTDQGEPIYGNSKWFYSGDGTWFWSGAVNV